MTKSACPCGTGKTYIQCCEPFIMGKAHAPTAEALMRSRYTAYTKQAIEYVGATHDPTGADDFDATMAKNWSESTDWLGLEIKATEAGLESDAEGTVEFVARFRAKDDPEKKELTHHEVSLFKKLDGRWYYVDGKTVRVPVTRTQPKIGRNDPCPCGSGKKFKKCCALNQA